MWLAQLNCQGAYAIICEIDVCLFERGNGIALIQELYATNGCIRGLPAQMLVFADTRCNAVVIVTDVNIDCVLLVCTHEWGVCVCFKGVFYRVCVVIVY